MGARALRLVAFSVMTAVGVLGSAFAAGYALDDPGGLVGAGLVTAWTVPMVGLGAFALLAPDRATPLLVAATYALLAFAAVDAVFGVVPTDEVGPAVTLAVLAVSVAVGCLGLHRPGRAARLLLTMVVVVAVLTVAVIALHASGVLPPGPGPAVGSSGALLVPVLLVAVLFRLAADAEIRQAESLIAPAAADRPASSRATGTRNGEQDT